jgi:predicted nuclease of predicted toxin-antitoxin system
MRLLDANVDVHLVPVLSEFGISSDTAANRGWKALQNGDLVAAAMAAGFDCVVTRDQGFAESAARALRSYPALAVVILRLAQKPWPQYRQTFLEAWSASPIRPVAGRLVQWP